MGRSRAVQSKPCLFTSRNSGVTELGPPTHSLSAMDWGQSDVCGGRSIDSYVVCSSIYNAARRDGLFMIFHAYILCMRVRIRTVSSAQLHSLRSSRQSIKLLSKSFRSSSLFFFDYPAVSSCSTLAIFSGLCLMPIGWMISWKTRDCEMERVGGGKRSRGLACLL